MKQQRITHLLVVKKKEARKMLEKLPSLQPAPDVASLSSHVLAHPCWPNIFQIGSLSVADGTAILTLLSPRKKRSRRARRFEGVLLFVRGSKELSIRSE